MVTQRGRKSLHLSPREAEVLTWTACGRTNADIAKLVGISEETVRSYIKQICKRYEARNRTHATAIALVHRVIPQGPSEERVIALPAFFGLTEPTGDRGLPAPSARNRRGD